MNFFGKIQDWILKSQTEFAFLFQPLSLSSCCTEGTEESFLRVDCLVPIPVILIVNYESNFGFYQTKKSLVKESVITGLVACWKTELQRLHWCAKISFNAINIFIFMDLTWKNLKNGVFTRTPIKCFPSIRRRRNLKTEQLPVLLVFVFEENSGREIT